MPETYKDDEQQKIPLAEMSDPVEEVTEVQNSDNPNNAQRREPSAPDKKRVVAAIRDPFLGTSINERYQILSMIGKGATSAVYKAQDQTTNELVAIKILHSHLVSVTSIVERFEQEAKTSRLLQHPNIVGVREVDIAESGNPFLVMDFVEGISLQDRIKTTGWLPTQQAVQIFLQLCAALSVAHEKGVIHRDLKPSNIMLIESEDGTWFVKVLDFGIAKILPGQGDTVMKLTQTGETLGSLLYMSPEQCLDQDLDGRSDCYSLGCVMYETITGQPPLCARTAFETMNKHMTELPERLDKVRPDIEWPTGLQEVVFKALAKAPAQRYQKIGQLQDDLKALLSGSAHLPGRLIAHDTPGAQVVMEQERVEQIFKQMYQSRGDARQNPELGSINQGLASPYRQKPGLDYRQFQECSHYVRELTRKSFLLTAPMFFAILVFSVRVEDWSALLPVGVGSYALALAVFVLLKKEMWIKELPFRPTDDFSPESDAIAGWWRGQFEYSSTKGFWGSDRTFTAAFSYSNGAIKGSITDNFGLSKVIGMVDYPIIRFKKIYKSSATFLYDGATFLYEGSFAVDGSISGTWRQAGLDTWTGTWTMKPIDSPMIENQFRASTND